MSRKRPIFISISIVKTISINVSDNDYRILTEIAKDQRRRLADFSYLLYARGLTFFFCETPVCISKIESDYTEADRLQQKINADLEKHLSLMKYQIVPVLFFVDKNDKIGSVIINSWNDDYVFNIGTKYKVDIDVINQFQTMVSVMPGEESINFIFDFLNLSNNHKIYLNENDYNNFEYIYIEFFYEHSLEADITSYIINMR